MQIAGTHIELSDKQALALDRAFDKKHSTVVFAGAWRAGKTYLALLFAIISALKLDRIRILIARMYYTDLSNTTLRTLHSEILPQFRGLFVWNENKHTLTCIKTGSEIVFAGLDPKGKQNTLGGLTLTHCIIDEAQEMTPDILTEIRGRLSYRLEENNIISKLLIVSNPDRGFLYREFWLPYRKKQLADDIAFIPISMKDNRSKLPKHYYDSMNEEKLGRDRYMMYVVGDWDYWIGENDMFISNEIYDLFTSSNDGMDSSILRGKYISVDVAGMGDDKTVLVYCANSRISDIQIMEKKNTPEVVQAIQAMQSKYGVANSHVIIDVGGNAGHADYIRGCVRYLSNAKVLPSHDMNYVMLRDQLIYKLSNIVKTKSLRFDPVLAHYADDLAKQAALHRAINIDKAAKQQVSPKSSVKKQLSGKSPDLFDAVYMLMYWTIRKNTTGVMVFNL